MASENDKIYAALASIGLLADLISILTFSYTGAAFTPWTAQWMIVIFLIMFIFFMSALAADASKLEKLKFGIEMIYACIFYFCSALTLLATFYATVGSKIGFFDYFGFIVMAAISFLLAFLISGIPDRYPSYLFYFVTFSETVLMMKKYLFSGFHVTSVSFIGEIALLVFSGILALCLMYDYGGIIRGKLNIYRIALDRVRKN